MAPGRSTSTYQFDTDDVTKQRIPLWLCRTLVYLICSLANSEAQKNSGEPFDISSASYTYVQDMMANSGWYVRRTAISHAYQSFRKLKADQVLAVLKSNKDHEQLIPDRAKQFQPNRKIVDQPVSVRGISQPEADDLRRLRDKPTPLAKYLDRQSLEMPRFVNRSMGAAQMVQIDPGVAEAEADAEAALEVELWAAMSNREKYELERGWSLRAKSQAATDVAMTIASRLEDQVKRHNRAFTLNNADHGSGKKGKNKVQAASDNHEPGSSRVQPGDQSHASHELLRSALKNSSTRSTAKSVRWEE